MVRVVAVRRGTSGGGKVRPWTMREMKGGRRRTQASARAASYAADRISTRLALANIERVERRSRAGRVRGLAELSAGPWGIEEQQFRSGRSIDVGWE